MEKDAPVKVPDSLPAAFLSACSTTPEKTFIYFEGHSFSYRSIYQSVCQVAGSLRAWGLRRGDRVALYLENSPGFIAAYLGILWLGGVIVPINTRYRETELHHMLHDSGARLVVTDAAGHSIVHRVSKEISSIERVLEVSQGLSSDTLSWRALHEAEPVHEHVHLGQKDLAAIGHTSGTTGRSKVTMRQHGNFCSNSAVVTEAWGWTPDDHLLLVLPLFHMHGIGVGLHGTLIQGSTLTLKRKFDAAETLDELNSDRISMFFGIPTMYLRLLDEGRRRSERPHSIRLLVSGSAPLSPQTLAEVEKVFGLRILERYGMMETVMNLGNPLRGERKAGSVGVPFRGIEVRIADPASGAVLPEGAVGEVQLRGPNITAGYWQNPQATKEMWTRDGWFKTGDLGYCDFDGYLFLTGRAKELIISGGFNIYPREVEEVLETHPAVAETAVLELPDHDLGEKVVAAVVSSGEPDGEALQQFCRERLASFKKPRDIYFVASLPRNALGKVQKHLLRAQLMASLSSSAEEKELPDVRT